MVGIRATQPGEERCAMELSEALEDSKGPSCPSCQTSMQGTKAGWWCADCGYLA